MTPPSKSWYRSARTPTPVLALTSIDNLETAFGTLAPGSTMVYWSGRSLVELCWDEERGQKTKAATHQAMRCRAARNWAAGKQIKKLGFLTQKKIGNTFDYRVTKAMERTRWPREPRKSA